VRTEFANYISLDPVNFSLYGLALIGVMFIWAYGLLRLRTFYKNTHVHTNFHLGLCFMITAGLFYPIKVHEPSSLSVLIQAFLYTGVPLALCQILMVASVALNKKTGQLTMLTMIPVLIGYALSYFRYGERIGIIEAVGSFLIILGFVGVINLSTEMSQAALIGAAASAPVNPTVDTKQRIYNVIKM
jgi:drug/metabolite transporter (DMT)-like permease